MVKNYECYEGHDLGALYQESSTTFRVWAPGANKVELNLYGEGFGDNRIGTYAMEKAEAGTWACVITRDCNGFYYTYRVTQDGNTEEAIDPYAKAVGINGKRAMVVKLADTNPKGFESDAYTNPKSITDAVIYEGSVRDLTMDSSSGAAHKGKFLGLAEEGTVNHFDEPTGLDYISRLGITHVQILPSFDFETVDESNPMIRYNWGYDPDNYNVPEGSYATDAYRGELRIQEMKQMILALHQRNIGVIMDVVYNHTYRTKDSNLNKIVPDYYYRSNEQGFSNGSGCGNEIASDRPMVRKLIIDSLLYWMQEYHIDGFRFDLMGVLDIETIQQMADTLRAVKPDVYLYGEGWNGGDSSLPVEKRALKVYTKQLHGVGCFNDDIRDTIKGSVFYDSKPGFVNGAGGLENALRFGIVGATEHPQVDYDAYGHTAWADAPGESINYVSCHDNYTLWDKLCVSAPKADIQTKYAMNRLTAAIIFTSQGVPFIQAGEEMLRSKPIPGTYTFAENSYNLSDEINSVKWDNIHTYGDMVDYYSGLMAFRKAHKALRMERAADIAAHLHFLNCPKERMVAYKIDAQAVGDSAQQILVIFNANTQAEEFELPDLDTWQVCVSDERAGKDAIFSLSAKAVIKPVSALVMIKE